MQKVTFFKRQAARRAGVGARRVPLEGFLLRAMREDLNPALPYLRTGRKRRGDIP